MYEYNPIAESNNFIVLDKYEKHSLLRESAAVYQTESSLEREFIQDLKILKQKKKYLLILI